MKSKTILILAKYNSNTFIDLNESVLKYCGRYKNEKDKNMSLFGYMVLTKYLQSYLSIDLFIKNINVYMNGKPYFEGFEYNISNTGEYVLVGISQTSPIGLDIESLEHVLNNQKAVKAYLNIDEQFDYYNSKDPDFFLLTTWCKKEAFAKFTGKGLSICPIPQVINKKFHINYIDSNLCLVCFTNDEEVELVKETK
ncbi:MAG: 4'-phosphopantetheinyl transferase superfamily protein [Erysipelotrichaceae bacterium]|nr:4'-phosphopantetheinyl transferase superfamily protein [Erysipelotrichaceae bacterium]